MFVATVVVSLVLAGALVGSAVGKLTENAAVVAGMNAVGVPTTRFWMLAVLELAGAAGLALGLLWAPLGVAAALGVIAYFVGALVFHVRARDLAGMPPAASLLVLAVAALVLRLVTA